MKHFLPLTIILLCVPLMTASTEVKFDEKALTPIVKNEYSAKIKNVLEGFDKLIFGLQEKVVPESEITSFIAVSPFQPKEICVTSKEELEEITQLIEDMKNDTTTSSTIHVVQPGTCPEFDRLKIGILKLQHDFHELVTHQVSSATYAELKVSYETKLRDLQRKMDDALRDASENDKKIIENLRSELQSQQDEINNILKELEEKQKTVDDTSTQLCAIKLKENNIDAALDAFRNVGDKSRIKDIILSAYENVDSFQMLYDFMQRVEDVASMQDGYTALFDKMKSRNDMNIVNLLKLASQVKKKNMENLSKSVIDAIQQTRNYKPFFDYLQSDTTKHFGSDVMPLFVENVYKKDANNLEVVLNLRKNFKYACHQLNLLQSLINEMKSLGQVQLQKFFLVINDVSDMGYSWDSLTHSDEKDIQLYERIVYSIPDNVQPLVPPYGVAANLVCIKNSAVNEYVYAGDVLDGNRRKMFTIKSERYTNQKIVRFLAEYRDRGQKFRLRSLTQPSFESYLYVDGGALLSQTQITIPGEPDAFSIEIADDTNVRIKNVHTNQYLYSPTDRQGMQRAVLLESQVDSNGLWLLSDCSELDADDDDYDL